MIACLERVWSASLGWRAPRACAVASAAAALHTRATLHKHARCSSRARGMRLPANRLSRMSNVSTVAASLSKRSRRQPFSPLSSLLSPLSLTHTHLPSLSHSCTHRCARAARAVPSLFCHPVPHLHALLPGRTQPVQLLPAGPLLRVLRADLPAAEQDGELPVLQGERVLDGVHRPAVCLRARRPAR